ncbi:MAG: cytochrome c maturation protein CcmE [Pseudomonadota bacterium]
MTPRRRRMLVVSLILAGVGLAAFFGLTAFQKNLLYFLTPSQVAQGEAPKGHSFRIGGLVVKGTVRRAPDTLEVHFDLTDGNRTVGVSYTGILPDLFREGQGIIAIGKLSETGVFEASEVLAKHDENYMPPEVAESLKATGQMPQPPEGTKK